MSDEPKMMGEEEAKDRLNEIMVNGKLLALETGLMTGALDPEYVRSEASDILRRHSDHLSEATKKRLQALLVAGGNPGSIH